MVQRIGYLTATLCVINIVLLLVVQFGQMGSAAVF